MTRSLLPIPGNDLTNWGLPPRPQDRQVSEYRFGPYNPDFGVVMRHSLLRDGVETELHPVVETKDTDDIDLLDEDERLKIQCAVKHFDALGIKANTSLVYRAPATAHSGVSDEESAYQAEGGKAGYFGPASSFHAASAKATSDD